MCPPSLKKGDDQWPPPRVLIISRDEVDLLAKPAGAEDGRLVDTHRWDPAFTDFPSLGRLCHRDAKGDGGRNHEASEEGEGGFEHDDKECEFEERSVNQLKRPNGGSAGYSPH